MNQKVNFFDKPKRTMISGFAEHTALPPIFRTIKNHAVSVKSCMAFCIYLFKILTIFLLSPVWAMVCICMKTGPLLKNKKGYNWKALKITKVPSFPTAATQAAGHGGRRIAHSSHCPAGSLIPAFHGNALFHAVGINPTVPFAFHSDRRIFEYIFPYFPKV